MSKIQKAPIGLIFAMKEEQEGLELHFDEKRIIEIGQRRFICGQLWGQEVVAVLSGIGKVAAASTTSLLIHQFKVREVVLTGVAGAADPSLNIGDIVIADQLVQHDMNAEPLFPRFEIPLTGKSFFESDLQLREKLKKASNHFVEEALKNDITVEADLKMNLKQVRIYEGWIASGDQFIHDANVLHHLKQQLPALLAVEMEGAAIAQVCHDFQTPFAILRTISDKANEQAHIDFSVFVQTVAAPTSLGVLRNYLREASAQLMV